jgi:hypothetical protein
MRTSFSLPFFSSAATSKLAARALQNLSFDHANQIQMLEEEAVPVLAKLLDMGDDDPETAGFFKKISFRHSTKLNLN